MTKAFIFIKKKKEKKILYVYKYAPCRILFHIFYLCQEDFLAVPEILPFVIVNAQSPSGKERNQIPLPSLDDDWAIYGVKSNRSTIT